MKKKILIVGGTGFIGYHLSKQCIKKMERYKFVQKKTKKVSFSKERKIFKLRYF